MKIAQFEIGTTHPPFILAEMSGNHNQSLDRALALVDAAHEAGAHGVKLQTYTADTMTIDHSEGEFFITDDKSLWKGESLYNLYEKAHTPWEWHRPIFDRCKELGMTAFSSPFDESSVDFLEGLGVPAYKIASFENTDHKLIAKVAKTGKPLIISTGMAQISEIDEAVRVARENGAKDIILLKCTSTYPATPESTNISTIPHLKTMFGTEVGLSDHTMGIGVSVASVAFGAVFVEKHFTMSRDDGGVDSAFSLEPHELKLLVDETKRAWQGIGKPTFGPSGSNERKSLQYRRTLYVVENIKKGDVLTSKNVRAIRPGHGLPVKYYNLFLGKKVTQDISRGTPLSFDVFE